MAEKPCQFCKIAAEVPEWVVDHGTVVSFKPFGAVHPMHRLFIPKEHIVFADESPIITGECFKFAAAWAAGKHKPFNLIVQSGHLAGQGTWHLHVHYVPREAGDGLGYRWKSEEAKEK